MRTGKAKMKMKNGSCLGTGTSAVGLEVTYNIRVYGLDPIYIYSLFRQWTKMFLSPFIAACTKLHSYKFLQANSHLSHAFNVERETTKIWMGVFQVSVF